MTLASIERKMAAEGRGCLGKAKDDEPVFILRAQDATAANIVRVWADGLAYHRGNDHPKVVEARRLADMMDNWHEAGNGTKIPD